MKVVCLMIRDMYRFVFLEINIVDWQFLYCGYLKEFDKSRLDYNDNEQEVGMFEFVNDKICFFL